MSGNEPIRTEPGHPEIRDDVAAYAIGVLELGQSDRVERHLADCGACRDYLEWLLPAVDALPASVEQLTPPPSLRRSILADVRAEQARSAPAGRARGGLGFFLRPATAFVAAGILLVGVAGGYLLQRSGSDAGPSQVELIAAVPTADAPTGTATGVLERDGDAGTLHIESLPAAGPGETYQAWVQHNGAMVPSSTFAGDAGEAVELEGTLDGASGVYVTLEPDGGSPAPTSDPVLAALLG